MIFLIFATISQLLQNMNHLINSHHVQSEKCSQFNGKHLIKNIKESRTEIHKYNSSVVTYNAKSIHRGDNNWLVYIFKNATITKNYISTPVEFQKINLRNGKHDIVGNLIQNTLHQKNIKTKCLKKTLIVIDYVDYWNWWWVLVATSSHYTILLSIADDIELDDVAVLHLKEDNREKKNYLMPLRNIYYRLFSNKKNIRLNPKLLNNECYSSIVLLPTRENPSILKNIKHSHDHCISSILKSYKYILMNNFRISNNIGNKICWMYRRTKIQITSWQKYRIIYNQDIIINTLNIVKLDFHGKVSIHQQFKEISNCQLLIGAHGAGLNLVIGMRKPVLMELTPGKIMNRNAHNIITALNGCLYTLDMPFIRLNFNIIQHHIEKVKLKCDLQ